MKSYFARRMTLLMIFFSTLFTACSERQVDDALLTARVKAEMTADGRISPSRVDVDTLNGNVTLSGETPTQEEKSAAEEVASKVQGVRGVSNQIVVNPAVAGTGIPSGDEMKQRAEKTVSNVEQGVKTEAQNAFLLGSVKARLAAAGYGGVGVSADRGVVTLRGETSSDKDRIAAEAIVEKIKGVRKVNNQLTVRKPAPPPAATPTGAMAPCPGHSPSPRRR
jgi:hyperosmotically inducible periplasmic protein